MSKELSAMTTEGVVNEAEAAKIIGFSPITMRNWRRQGKGPKFLKFKSRAVRYRKCDLFEWLENQSSIAQSTSTEKVG